MEAARKGGLEVRLDRPIPVDTVVMQFNPTYFEATALHSGLSKGYRADLSGPFKDQFTKMS